MTLTDMLRSAGTGYEVSREACQYLELCSPSDVRPSSICASTAPKSTLPLGASNAAPKPWNPSALAAHLTTEAPSNCCLWISALSRTSRGQQTSSATKSRSFIFSASEHWPNLRRRRLTLTTLLVNNAAMLPRPERTTTPEGLTEVLATNHLSHFLLTTSLLPLLRKAAEDPNSDVRVVCVSISL